MPENFLPRAITVRYLETIAARRVTVISGPRQAGKTTLVAGQLAATGGELRSLDDEAMLAAALADPVGFVASASRPLVIDEVQRGREPLVRAIKASVDRDRRPGQFVLTGSSNFLTVPTISESLAGRAAFVEVWPFTQGELAGRAERFVQTLFATPDSLKEASLRGLTRGELLERVCAGGYPEALALAGRQRAGWFRDYVRTTIERDVQELSGIRRSGEMAQLLRLLAARSGCELVMQGVIEDSALERQAVYGYRGWLQTIHLVALLPAFSRNLTGRVKKRPKLFVTDSGLAAWLLGKTPAALVDPTDPATGRLVETFVFGELLRQLTWSGLEASLFHWQDHQGREVDFVLEAADGRVLAIEVKAGQSPRSDWFCGLAHLRDRLAERFVAGVVLYTGRQTFGFGDRLSAAPISALWEM